MSTLIIDNIGPIKHIRLELRKVNVIIGPQSSGKSCVLKIASFCAWAEKHIQLEQSKRSFEDKDFILEHLINFHKLNGFFEESSKIEYKGETMSFSYCHKGNKFEHKWIVSKKWKYKRSKIAYIPAERNVIGMIPNENMLQLGLGKVNIREFISEWWSVRQKYGKEAQYNVLGLGIQYYYDEKSGLDMVTTENGKSLEFGNASSGIQSATPMCVYLDYLFEDQYSISDKNEDKFKETQDKAILMSIYESRDKKYQKNIKNSAKKSFFKNIDGKYKLEFASEDDYKECSDFFNNFTKAHSSDIYLEEPEQNLFPQTQVKLIYDIIRKSKIHDDNVFIATHSPYVLYALNNCLLASLVQSKVVDEDFGVIRDSLLNPNDVSVWELKDGELNRIGERNDGTIQLEDGLISDNFFDEVMKDVMTDFTNLSMYYD